MATGFHTNFVYAAVAGEPPIGQAAFMHRDSGRDNPLAPIGHHVLDATHLAHGVLTFGFTAKPGVKLEASRRGGSRDFCVYDFDRDSHTLCGLAEDICVS